MHEMSIAHNILCSAQELRLKHQAKHVVSIKVMIGTLSGVESDQLKFAFDIYRREFADCLQAELKIEHQDLILQCRDCHQTTQTNEMVLSCGHCQSLQVTVLQGREMTIEQVEMDLC